MINGIDSRNYTNPYQNNVKKVNSAGEDAPAFLLGNDENGVVWERQQEKEKKSNSEDAIKKQKDEKETTLHSNKVDSAKIVGGNNSLDEQVSPSFSNIIKKITESLKKILRGMANFFWYGNEKNATNDENEKTELPGAEENLEAKVPVNEAELEGPEKGYASTESTELTEEEQEQKIRELLKNNEKDAVMDLITDHNKKQLAKNSTLLTQYDKHGSLRELSGSEQIRILSGDKAIKM